MENTLAVEFLTPDVIRKDLEAINTLLQEYKTTITMSDLEDILNQDRILVIRDEKGVIVGMAGFFVYRKPTGLVGVVEDVVVSPDYRKRGLGRKLMEEILHIARTEKLKYVFLTSNPARVPARALYRSLGFKEWETTPFRIFL
ncbi:MAG TPA: GNAT family N-acetyltransferase [Candidatus Paceibacterota bacterium]|nr:GNAT family N-acetyltransferase [Candidatus Paceibacterota bacterium]